MKEKYRVEIIIGHYHIIQQRPPSGFSINIRERNTFEYLIRIDDYNKPPHLHCGRFNYVNINPAMTLDKAMNILKKHIIKNNKIDEEKLYRELL